VSGFNCCTCIFSLCWGMQDFWWQRARSYLWHAGSSALTRDPTWPPALGAWSLSHWTAREVHACLISNVGPRGDYNNSLLLLRDPGWQRNHHKLLWDLLWGEKRGWQIDWPLNYSAQKPHTPLLLTFHHSNQGMWPCLNSRGVGSEREESWRHQWAPVMMSTQWEREWMNEWMSSAHKDREMGPGRQARLGGQFLTLLWTWVPCSPVGPASTVKWLGLIMPLTVFWEGEERQRIFAEFSFSSRTVYLGFCMTY